MEDNGYIVIKMGQDPDVASNVMELIRDNAFIASIELAKKYGFPNSTDKMKESAFKSLPLHIREKNMGFIIVVYYQ